MSDYRTHRYSVRCREHPHVRTLARCRCRADHGWTWVDHGAWCPGDPYVVRHNLESSS